MTPLRLLAIAFIFVATSIAWAVLGATIVERTGEQNGSLRMEVEQLWGGVHRQTAPTAWYEVPRTVERDVQERELDGRVVTRRVTETIQDRVPVAIVKSDVHVTLDLDQRKKGLLWYDTYGVDFAGSYAVQNPTPVERTIIVHVDFPSDKGIYDGFVFEAAGQPAPPIDDLARGATTSIVVPAHGKAPVKLQYRSRGLEDWSYVFGTGVSQVRDFRLTMKTDSQDVDFPAGALSPTTKVKTDDGMTLTWTFASVVTGQRIGLDMPSKLNPGPIASRISFFAPVSLLFFLTVMVILGVMRGQSLHPMNYFFLSGAFFAFHLLLAYLVDHVDIHAAFAVAAATSVFLVVSYLRLVAGTKVAFLQAGTAQLVFLVLFSYAFFFEGRTGLTVVLGAVATLFVLMQLTARVDWAAAFERDPKAPAPPPSSGSPVALPRMSG